MIIKKALLMILSIFFIGFPTTAFAKIIDINECEEILKSNWGYSSHSFNDGYLYGDMCYTILAAYHEVDLKSFPYTWYKVLNKYKTNNSSKVTRENAIKYIIESFGIVPFNYEDHIWADENLQSEDNKKYIDYAYYLGIISGTGDNYFNPQEYITCKDFYTMLKNTDSIKTMIEPEYNFYYENNFTRMISSKFQKAMHNIPENIRNSFYNNGWNYYLMEYPYRDNFFCEDNDPEYTILGTTSKYRKNIQQVVWYETYYHKDTVSTLYHEMGHYTYYLYSLNEEDIEKIKEEESLIEVTGDKYCKTSEKEYFAEAFCEYITNPNELSENCPQTYKFIDNLLNQ